MKYLLLLVCCPLLFADNYLLGDLGGLREEGIEIEAISTNDIWSNVSGGTDEKTGVLGTFDLSVALDTEKFGMWPSGVIFLYGIGNYGFDPSKYIGDAQATNNLESPDDVKLYEAWYNHAFDSLDVLVGLHDLNSEFAASNIGGLFINSSFGISPEFSQVGPSIFPTSALGVRGKFAIGENSYFAVATYDGIPGYMDKKGTRIRLDSDDGLLTVGEVSIGSEARFALGSWYHTPEETSNKGGYAIFDYQTSDTVGLFGQAGFADRANEIRRYFGLGFVFGSVIAEEDKVGLALNRVVTEDYESVVEVTYEIQPLEWLSVQPDVQYVINPGYKGDDALVLGLRTSVAF